MGYHTDLDGFFRLDKPLASEHASYLTQFSRTRRMKRSVQGLEDREDLVRAAAGLPLGPEGAYFVAGEGFMGQGTDSSIVDYNSPPEGQPGLWCQWTPSEDGKRIEWDGAEKFYHYIDWIKYLIQHFLSPWGYRVNGQVFWYGEDRSDLGKISIKDNKVSVLYGSVVYRAAK
jgi:hypothetical protein